MISSIKTLGQSHMFLRIASIIAGTTLWFYVLNSEPVRTEREFPLKLLLPESQVIANNWPQMIKVELKGARVFLENVDSNGIEIVTEVAPSPKRQTLRLTPNMIALPFGVEVVSIIPDSINLQLVKESAKSLKIRPIVTGEVGPDFAYDIEKISPSTVKVVGPWNILKDLKDIPTVTMNWNDLDTSKGSVKINLRELDPRLKYEGISEIEIFFKVRPKKANLTLKNIPIRFVTTASRITSRVKEVSLDVLAPESPDFKLTSETVQVMADIPVDKKGNLKVDLRAVLPEGVHLLQIHPSSININVK